MRARKAACALLAILSVLLSVSSAGAAAYDPNPTANGFAPPGSAMQQSIAELAKSMFGQAVVDAPLLLILLAVLCWIAAILTYRYSCYLFEEGAKSPEERKREMVARAVLSVIAFVLPLAINRFADFYAALIVAIAEILLIIMFGYFKGSAGLKSKAEEF